MTNEELKKKIVEIVINAIWKDAEADYDSTDETEACSIADALIAAGIGDVAETEHRAKVAERALKICLINNLHCYECDMGFDGKCKGTDKDKEKCAMLEIDDYIQQAEKELAEEKKDEK